MQEKLTLNCQVSNDNKLRPDSEPGREKEFLSLFSVDKFSSPELIWNEQTRTELLKVLHHQINSFLQSKNEQRVQ